MSDASRVTNLERENAQLKADLATVTQQLDWFKRQLFGAKSEKRLDIDPAVQGNLLEALGVATPPSKPPPTETVAYQRRKKQRDGAVNDTGLRFGEDVPREIIAVTDPEIEAIPEERRERIGEKVTYRLAQRPGSYVILEYTRPVYKRLDDLRILTPPAPANVLEKSAADVSFLAGMLVDKFCYHSVLRMRPFKDERKRCFTKDEGRPLGVGLQEQAPNRHKLRALRVSVVSVVGKGRARPCQVRVKETNASEPLMTCRKEFKATSKPERVVAPG